MNHLHLHGFLRGCSSIVCRSWVALGFCCPQAEPMSAPSGIAFVQGTGSATRQGSRLVLTVSEEAAVSLESLEIARAQSWIIHQPSTGSSLTILVRGGCPILIEGEIHANGQVSLISADGIQVGAQAVIDASRLTASST